MAITYSDTFTDTGGTRLIDRTADTGQAYTGSTDLVISSNALVKATSDAVVRLGFVSGLTTSTNYEIQAVWRNDANPASTDILFSVQDSTNYYMLRFRSDALTLMEVVADTFTSIGSYAVTAADGADTSIVKLKVTGDSIAVDYGATLAVISVSSSALAKSGTLGFRVQGNFSGSTMTALTSITYESSAGYTQRKGSTFDVTHTLGTITTATLNGTAITINTTGAGTVNLTDISGIATSGTYDLVLGDGTGTETYTVQLNVVGLASYNINKDGADQASLTDVEFIVMTGVAGSRVIAEQITGVTTDVNGDTGAIEIADVSLNTDDVVTILQQSATVGGGLPHSATLVAL